MTKNTMRITLKPHEKLFLNGAVLRVDKKTTIELLNDATFLLNSHVLQVEETTTPLKQLYYAAQMALMEPSHAEEALNLFAGMLHKLTCTVSDDIILEALQECSCLLAQRRIFEMLKIIRMLFPREAEILEETAGKVAVISTNPITQQVKSEIFA